MNHSIKRMLFDPRTDAVGQSPGGAGRHIDRPEQGILESGGSWWAILDSNQGPQSYQDCALTC